MKKSNRVRDTVIPNSYHVRPTWYAVYSKKKGRTTPEPPIQHTKKWTYGVEFVTGRRFLVGVSVCELGTRHNEIIYGKHARIVS